MLSRGKGEADPGSWGQANRECIPGQLPDFPPPSLAADLLLPVIIAAPSSMPASSIMMPPRAQTGSSLVPLRLLHHASAPFPLSRTQGKFLVALDAQVVVLQMKSGEGKMA